MLQPPRFVPCYLGLLGVCAAAALRSRQPAALALWVASALCGLFAASSPREAAADLGQVLAGLRRRDPRPLWAQPAPDSPVAVRLPGEARRWMVLAGIVSLTLLVLAVLSR